MPLWGRTWLYFLIPMVALVAFYQSLTYGYVSFDDQSYVVENQAIRRPNGLMEIWSRLEMPEHCTNWPLVFTSYWLETQVGGDRPEIRHLTNVMLHAIAAVFCAAWLFQTGVNRSNCIATAILFAVNPLHADSVAWISERKNTLSAMFFFLALFSYERYRLREARGIYIAYVVLTLLALLSKSSTVILPIIAAMSDFFFRQEKLAWPLLRRQLIPLSMVICISAVTLSAERAAEPISPVVKLVAIPTGFLHYAVRILLPLDWPVFTPAWEIDLLDVGWWLSPIGLALLLVFLCVSFRRFPQSILFGLSFFFISMTPVSGIVSFGWMQFHWIGNHLAYLPSVGLLLAAVVAARAAINRCFGRFDRVASFIVLTTIVVANLWMANVRVEHWRNDHELFNAIEPGLHDPDVVYLKLRHLLKQDSSEDVVRPIANAWLSEHPDDVSILAAVAEWEWKRGEFDTAGRRLDHALKLDPQYHDPLIHLGNALAVAGRHHEALACYNDALAIRAAASTWAAIGAIHHAMGDELKAEAAFRESLEMDPWKAVTHFNLGIVLLETGRPMEAVVSFERALKLRPQLSSGREALATARRQAGLP